MNRKAFFIDFDGTLMSDDKTISERNRETLCRAVEAGHYIVLATGRAVSSARPLIQRLGLKRPGCYLIAYNGAAVYDCAADTMLYNRRLPVEYAEYLYNEAEAAGLYIQTYSETQILAPRWCRELEFYKNSTTMDYRIEGDVWSMLNEEPPKMLLIELDDKSRLERFQAEHLAWEKGKCTSFFSCAEYLEYCPLGATKGAGVRFMREFLKLPNECTVAIGDQENDISMIREAGIGVAMKNGAQSVKDAADFVSEVDNNHDGVAGVIERFWS